MTKRRKKRNRSDLTAPTDGAPAAHTDAEDTAAADGVFAQTGETGSGDNSAVNADAVPDNADMPRLGEILADYGTVPDPEGAETASEGAETDSGGGETDSEGGETDSGGAEASEKVERHAPKKNKSRRPQRRLNYVRRLILLVCSALFVFSAYNLVDSLIEYKIGDDMYSDLEHSFVSFPSTAPTATPEPVPNGPAETPENLHDLPGVSLEPESPQISYVQDYAPDVWPDVDFEGLRGINADTEAWLLCVGTNINYPVVHSKDNEDYLNTMFDGRRSKLGTLFVDARNKWNFTDRNTIIYGHNMRNHSMLWTLTEYKNQSFYDEHPTMRLILPDGKYELHIFSAAIASADETQFWSIWFRDDEDFQSWVSMLKANSKVWTEVEVTAEDKVVTLSTCTYEFSDARFLVYGKLVAVE